MREIFSSFGLLLSTLCICFNCLYLLKLSIDITVELEGDVDQAAKPNPEKTLKALSYKILKHNDIMNVNLLLSGTDYESSKYCLIKKYNEVSKVFDDFTPCVDNAQTHGNGKCVRICTGENNKLTYDIFSPRTKYVEVFVDQSADTVSKKTTDPTIFGLEIPMLVNPQVTITKNNDKLKFSTKTCKKVACPIFYKGIKYVEGTEGTSCIGPNSANEVPFDLMIPEYEMICTNYPSFFYKLQNKYTLLKTEVYIPQYYVKYNKDDKTKYLLKFTNKFPFEICRFGIKDDSVKITAGGTGDYKSNCGGQAKDCYAPCNDVELIFEASKTVVEILIQTRNFEIKKKGTDYEGYSLKKYVITEPNAGNDAGKLLSGYASTGVILNVPLFNPDISKKFKSCTVTYYAADEPLPVTGAKAKCATGGKGDGDCATTCAESLTISQLASGKPYILEIKAAEPANGNTIPANFKERIFIRTINSQATQFPDVTPTINDTSLSIKAITTKEAVTKSDITCAYYLSPRGKDIYVCAICLDSYPCRGYCKESQNIVGLTPGKEYDLKVVAHKDYGFKVHQVTTKMSTLTLEKTYLENGFKVVGTLSSPYPEAICHYKVHVKKDDTYVPFFVCPTPSGTKTSESSIKMSPTPAITMARSLGQQPSSTPPNNAATITPCQSAPLCTNIIFSEGFEADKEYKVLVTALGRSDEVQIDIPINPLATQTPPVKSTRQLTLVITPVDKTLNIKVTLPHDIADTSLCKWKLVNSDDPKNAIVKSCLEINEVCKKFPPCKEFTITDVDDSINYELFVFHSEDINLSGKRKIDKDQKIQCNVGTNPVLIIFFRIIAVVVPVIIVVIGIGFYFGYLKNRN